MAWEHHSYYRGIEIEVFMPASIAYRAYYGGVWHTRESLSAIQHDIDDYLYEPPEPEPEPKKSTVLTLTASPTTGTPPYEVTLTARLTSGGVGVQYKTIIFYRNDVVCAIGGTDSDGRSVYRDIVTERTSYYAYFAGDDEYEGCDTKPAAGLGGLGLIILLILILGGK